MFGFFRTLLALLVVIGHLHGPSQIGTYAVFGFYILSGYLMTTIMHERYGYKFSGQVKFAINRFLRIFPTYWVAILISIICLLIFGDAITDFKNNIYWPTNLEEWTRNIFLIFTNSSRPRLSPATWALTVELFYYILICLGISKSRRRSLYWLGFSFLYTILLFLNNPADWRTRYFPIPAASLPFAIGASIYHYNELFKKALRVSRIKKPSIWLLVICLNFCLFFTIDTIFNLNSTIIIGFYLNLLFVTLCITALLAEGFPYISKEKDILIGKFSYPVYLIHWQAGAVISAISFQKLSMGFLSLNGVILLVASVILSFAISYLIIKYIDDPIDSKRKAIKAGIRYTNVSKK